MASERPAMTPEAIPRGLPAREERLRINVPAKHNPKLQKLLALVQEDDELYALWHAQNVNAITRLNMTDHGPVHVQIVANIALKLLRLLVARGMQPGIVADHAMTVEDAEVVVVLASLLHDVGMSIHRINHEEYSLIIADTKLREMLPALYPQADVRTIVKSEILHAIISHRSDGMPLTLEAGVVRLADALDMTHGRSRIPFERGSTSIHSVSALAIREVSIGQGQEKPIVVQIKMCNAAGVFQIDALLRKKLKGSGLEDYVQIVAGVEEDADCESFPLGEIVL
jgi:metal-dependent HD superfamily phosphatase/phosphodiesterase